MSDADRGLPPDERAEYEEMLREAADRATTRQMGEHLVGLLHDAEQAGRRWEGWILEDFMRGGATNAVKRWARRQNRVSVTWHGQVISKPRAHSVPKRDATGAVVGYQQPLWNEMTREQLLHKLTEARAHRRAADQTADIVQRLLALMDAFPDAATVDDALRRKGVTLDEYLAEVAS